jgi:hypothetical protein
MKKKRFSILILLVVLIGFICLGFTPSKALADGKEELGIPLIPGTTDPLPIAQGTGFVAAGTGLVSQPGTIIVDVPLDAVVKQALLYWEGNVAPPPAPLDDVILVNAVPVRGNFIGGVVGSSVQFAAYRADITGMVLPGVNSFEISGLDFTGVNNGAGVLVIIDDGSGFAEIEIRDGDDRAYGPWISPGDTTVPQTFDFAPADFERTATLDMFFASVSGSFSGGGFRPSAIEITIDGSKTEYNNLLDSVDGEDWDTVTLPNIIIPANVSSLTAQALSVDNLGIGGSPASFSWIAAGLSVPIPLLDCCEGDKPKLESITVQYTGDDCSATNNQQEGGKKNKPKVECDGDPGDADPVYIIASSKEDPDDRKAIVWFEGEVDLDETFAISAMNVPGKTKLKADTWVLIYDAQGGNLLQAVKFHTSCSRPLEVGDQFGSVLVVGCAQEPPPVEGECPDGFKVQVATVSYSGNDCSASNNSQPSNKTSCEGDPASANPVFIWAGSKEDPSDRKAKVWFEGSVALDDFFAIDATNAGKEKLDANTWVLIYAIQGGDLDLLQTINFHTSCSQPLAVGDVFGSVIVEELLLIPK